MKLTNLSILFFAIFLCIMVVTDQKVKSTEEIRKRQMIYNNALDNAVQDALVSAVDLSDGRTLTFDKEKVVDNFFRSLSISLKENQGKKASQDFKNYIPVLAMIEEDGFYIYYRDLKEEHGEKIIERFMTNKIPYRYDTQMYTYYFTITDYIRMEDKASGETIEGDFHDIRNIYPDSILANEAEYEQTKRNCITALLTEQITDYINRYNRVASHIGIQYTFALPGIEKEEWYQMINQVSILAFFQGYPYGMPSLGYYNRYALGAAKIEKGDYYFLQKDTATDELLYHRSECDLLYDRSYSCISRRECIREGAFRCERCG